MEEEDEKSLFWRRSRFVCSVMALPGSGTGSYRTADWDRADGSKVPGSVEVTGSGTDAVYTLVGDGNDIWDAADEGFFVYTTETGSWAIQGKFTWVDPGADVWSKFGPMVRADAESPGSPNFFMAARGNLGANDLVSPQWRLSQDGSSASHGPRVGRDYNQ